jgi:hypothetical protein
MHSNMVRSCYYRGLFQGRDACGRVGDVCGICCKDCIADEVQVGVMSAVPVLIGPLHPRGTRGFSRNWAMASWWGVRRLET